MGGLVGAKLTLACASPWWSASAPAILLSFFLRPGRRPLAPLPLNLSLPYNLTPTHPNAHRCGYICHPKTIHLHVQVHVHTWIMNGKEWKKNGIPGRGFSKAPRSEWSAGDTSPAKPWNISAPLYSNTIGLTEFCVGECIASNLQMNFSSTASM